MHRAMQRVIAGTVPLGCGVALSWVVAPLADAIPGRYVELLWHHFPGAQFEWAVAAIVLIIFFPLFIGGYILGWWLIQFIVPWEVANKSLTSADGNLAPLPTWIAKWYRR